MASEVFLYPWARWKVLKGTDWQRNRVTDKRAIIKAFSDPLH